MHLVGVRAAAQALGVSTPRVYDMIRVGILPPGVAVRLGRELRIDADRLESWVSAGGQALDGGWRREQRA